MQKNGLIFATEITEFIEKNLKAFPRHSLAPPLWDQDGVRPRQVCGLCGSAHEIRPSRKWEEVPFKL